MKLNRWIIVGSLCLAVNSYGQETTQTTKAVNGDKPTEPNRDPADARKKLEAAQREVQKAQQNIQNAQREAATARHDLEQVIRRQSTPPEAASRKFAVVRQAIPIRSFSQISGLRRTDSFVRSYGLDFVPADPVLRSQLGLSDAEGLVIIDVAPGGPADQAGIKVRDLIAKVELQSVSNVEKAQEIITKSAKPSVYLDLIREGKPLHLSMNKPGRDPSTTAFSYWIGTPVAPVDPTLRSHLPDLAADAGLIITDVVADSPAAKAGVRQFDILIRANDQAVNSNESLIKQIQASAGKPIKLVVLRAGKSMDLMVTPESRASDSPTVLQFYGNGQGFKLEPPAGLFANQPAVTLDNIAKNPYRVDSSDGTVGTNFGMANEIRGPLSGSSWAAPESRFPLTADKLEREMKELAAQLEGVQKAIAELNKRSETPATSPKTQAP